MRIIIGLFIVCLLGSCASVNNGVLIKRKYNKGYYFNFVSHKKASVKEDHFVTSQVMEEKPEIVKVENREKQITMAEPEIILVSNFYTAPSKNSAPIFASNKVTYQSNFKSPKQTLQTSVYEARSGARYDEIKLALWLILFIVLSFIYAFVIMLRNPIIPFPIALIVGMLGALLTMITGILWL